jgi:hypothetical protein
MTPKTEQTKASKDSIRDRIATALLHERLGLEGDWRDPEFEIILPGDLAAFLMQAQPPAFFEREVVFHLEPHHGGNTGEGIDHDADHGAVAQTDDMRCIDGLEEGACIGTATGSSRGVRPV